MTEDEDHDIAEAVHRRAEEHLNACFEALDAWETEEGDNEEDESPASAPFCGCSTCVVREVLFSAYEELYEIAKRDSVREAIASAHLS